MIIILYVQGELSWTSHAFPCDTIVVDAVVPSQNCS